MDQRPPAGRGAGGPHGELTASVDEDPFGPGDPLVVARLVRRSLAAAGRKAADVSALLVVTDRAPDPEALARFARRALGSRGADVPCSATIVDPGLDHARRLAIVPGLRSGGPLVIVLALGPGAIASVRCLGG